MHIDQALMAYLKSLAGLTALVGTRIHFIRVPQGTAMPYVIILDVSNVIPADLKGVLDIEEPNKQISTYASTKEGATAVADQLRNALDDFSGTLSGITVQHIRRLTDTMTDYLGEDGTTPVHIADLEFSITYRKE
jgi:hypothetical protein